MVFTRPRSFAVAVPGKNLEATEMATHEWVDYGAVEETPLFNNRKLLEPIGNIPPVESEANYYAQRTTLDMIA
jgi:putative transposase